MANEEKRGDITMTVTGETAKRLASTGSGIPTVDDEMARENVLKQAETDFGRPDLVGQFRASNVLDQQIKEVENSISKIDGIKLTDIARIAKKRKVKLDRAKELIKGERDKRENILKDLKEKKGVLDEGIFGKKLTPEQDLARDKFRADQPKREIVETTPPPTSDVGPIKPTRSFTDVPVGAEEQTKSSKLRDDLSKAFHGAKSFNELDQAKQQNVLQREQERAVERAEATQAIKAPSSGQQKEIAELRSSEDALFDLRDLFDKSFVGLFEGPKGRALNVFGLNPDKQAEFLAASATLENKVIKDITGAQMSEQEASRILRQVPRPSDADNVWAAKFKQTLKNIERIRRRKIEIIKQSGLREPITTETIVPSQQTEAGDTAESFLKDIGVP